MGISVVTALLAENVPVSHADVAGAVTPFGAVVHLPVVDHSAVLA